MYKLKLIAIAIIAIVGALLIYKHFENIKDDEIVLDRFSSEYNLVSEDNIFKYSSLDEILDIVESKTGVVFLCTPESNWCNYYAKYLNETLKESNIDVIYYHDIKSDRELNTLKYQKLLDILSSYLYKDDMNNSKLYMPDLTIVKDGNIIAHDNETALIESDQKEESYWTDEKISEFKIKINNYIYLLNN